MKRTRPDAERAPASARHTDRRSSAGSPAPADHNPTFLTRRRFLGLGALALALPAACTQVSEPEPGSSSRLTARPRTPSSPLPAGRHDLRLGSARDGFLYIPSSYQHDLPAPLLVLFHGAGRSATEWAGAQPLADQLGIVLLVPDSRGASWDAIHFDFGPDVDFVNAALNFTFGHVNVNAERIGLAGFSDGASYALSLGRPNGDLCSRLLAFSPGFVAGNERRGKPAIYITHGTRDDILPIDVTSREIVPRLREQGYSVQYVEFDGGHELSAAQGLTAFRWFLD
jgi:phospholipase/carboxylesterase